MGDIDYSKNDIFDINNQLFRRSRNNIGNSEALDIKNSEDKDSDISDLLLYGSELINNLKQINYTYEQVGSYIFSTSKINDENINEIIEAGDKVEVKDIKTPTTLLPVLDFPDPVKGSEDLPIRQTFKEYYEFLQRDTAPTLGEIKRKLIEAEREKLRARRIYDNVELDEDDNDARFLNYLRGYIGRLDQEIKGIIAYGKSQFLEDLKLPPSVAEGKDESKEESFSRESKMSSDKSQSYKVIKEYEPINRKRTYTFEEIYNKGQELLKEKQDLDEMERFIRRLEPSEETGLNRKKLEKLFSEITAYQKILDEERVYLEDLATKLNPIDEGDIEGAGLYGGAPPRPIRPAPKPRGRPKGATKTYSEALKAQKEQLSEARKVLSDKFLKSKDPTADDTLSELDSLPSKLVGDAKENLEAGKKLDAKLVDVVNTGPKKKAPNYFFKINELITSLIQYIGRTTVLYITRIKKNLKYLDEEQVKLIFDEIKKFNKNLDMLKEYENKAGAMIQTTLYKQLQKETLGLYNEINNSIRNASKVKDYTIFSSAGLRGGYFIQSDDPFIRGSITKRFL